MATGVSEPDAVVVGAGPNGLVAANLLADAGWSVVVLEAQPEPGGAVRTAELTLPGFRHDVFSAFYPLAAASPVFRRLALEDFGLVWRRSPVALAHPLADGRCGVLSTDLDVTAAALDAIHAGDGGDWRRLYGLWQRIGDQLLAGLATPFPPVLVAARLAATLGPAELARFARFCLLPVRRLAEEEFGGGLGGGLLLGGNALHTDLSPEAATSGMFGWFLACLGQEYGFPVPEGGAANLVSALVRRLERRGGSVVCNSRVINVEVRGGRAVAVRTAEGDEIGAAKAIVADVGAPALYLDLVGEQHLPAAVVEGIRRFQYDAGNVKVDWALDAPVPWTADPARDAGTIHVGDNLDELTRHCCQLATGTIPDRPLLVFGQQSVADETRCPPGKATAWAYSHVPQQVRSDAGGNLTGEWTAAEGEAFADRMEERVEALAPGFRSLVRARHVLTPRGLEAANANLVGGAVGGGTAQPHQQLIFRPVVGLGRPETPVKGLFLASASVHPGGGVHGACGANAARSVLAHSRLRQRVLTVGAGLGALVAAKKRPRRSRPVSEE